MDDKKKFAKLIISLALIAISVFALASFITHSYNDPPLGDYPVNSQVKNYCGKVGAQLSGYMLFSCGISSFIPFVFMCIVGVALLINRRIERLWVKIVGVILLTACLMPTTYLLGSSTHIPVLKADHGGLLGFAEASRLTSSFGIAGTIILMITGLVISFILINDSNVNSFLKSIIFRPKRSKSVPVPKPESKTTSTVPPVQPTINILEPKPIEPKPKEPKPKVAKKKSFSAFKNLHIPKINFGKLIPKWPKKPKLDKSKLNERPAYAVADEPVDVVDDEPVDYSMYDTSDILPPVQKNSETVGRSEKSGSLNSSVGQSEEEKFQESLIKQPAEEKFQEPLIKQSAESEYQEPLIEESEDKEHQEPLIDESEDEEYQEPLVEQADDSEEIEDMEPALTSTEPEDEEPRETNIPISNSSEALKVRLAPKDIKPQEKQDFGNYALPAIGLLEDPEPIIKTDNKDHLMERASVLQLTLKQFNVNVRVVGIEQGPVITMFELELAPGVKVAKIITLSDDLAIALKAPSVRVVAPLPNKSSVGLEIPNLNRRIVKLKEVIENGSELIKKQKIPLILGKDVAGEPLVSDMTAMPHLLIAGTTGSGKSVCLNTIILSVLCFKRPDEVKLLLVDPKMVEFSPYNDVPHLISPIVTDMRKAAAVLEWAVNKMEERYSLLSGVQVRNIDSYNNLGEVEIRKRLHISDDDDVDDIPFFLPYIIVIVDELADLMMVAAKEVESSVIRLSQKSRAVGIHLILATQRPSVNVVTGLIKSNMPSRISFFVASKIDSRTILDQNGAEKLLGAGDMLFLPPGTSKLERAQNAFVGDDEVRNVVEYLKSIAKPDYSPELKSWKGAVKDRGEEDEHYDEAVRIVLESQRGSVSLVQRRLAVGYSRASRLIDLMADDGIIGEYKGSQAREVYLTLEDWEKMKLPPL